MLGKALFENRRKHEDDGVIISEREDHNCQYLIKIEGYVVGTVADYPEQGRSELNMGIGVDSKATSFMTRISNTKLCGQKVLLRRFVADPVLFLSNV